MISVHYKDQNGWHDTQCITPACFANWRYVFTSVTQYRAVRDGKLFAEKRPEPFYLKLLQCMF